MINLEAELQIRGLHLKLDLLQEEQINTLFETQAQQFALLKEISQKLNRLLTP